MSGKGFSTITEQVAQLLKDGIRQGRWRVTIPGRTKLAAELGVNHKTVNAALQLLEKEGILLSRGAGREREIILDENSFAPSSLHIKILLYDKSDAHTEPIVQLSFRLRERGHHVSYADKSLSSLNFDAKRVSQMVEKDDADAWVVIAAPKPVLEWFAARSIPTFAMFGRHADLPMASLSTNKYPATIKVLHQLVDLGHRRIVMLSNVENRKPNIGLFEQWFLKQLENLGIQTGPYNLPDWDNDRGSIHRCLDSLFQHTPPTAVFINDPVFFFVTLQHLSSKGLAAPRDVSLVVMEDHPAFEWFDPEVPVLSTSTRRWVPRILQWVDHVAKGKDDRIKTVIHSKLIQGGMIGPVPKR